MTKNHLKTNIYITHALCLALCLALLAGCGGRVPKLGKLAPTDVVVAFGDSLTFGVGAPEGDSYPAVLGQLIGRNVVRSGVPGEVTAGGLARLQGVIDEHKPRLMIVCLGGNDILRRLDEAQTKSNLRDIVRMLKAQNIDVVLVGVPRPALITHMPPLFEQIAKEFGIPFEDAILGDVLHQPDQKSDTVHPNAKGYRRIAEAIAALLKKAGAV